MTECQGIITFQSPVYSSKKVNYGPREGWRTVLTYRCPVCGHERKLIKNWHGPTPNGGIKCGYPINENLEEQPV